MKNTLMMVLDYVGDEGAMVNAQVGHHPLARATETSPKRSSGTLSCLSARPPDLANLTAAQPGMACVRPSIVPFLYSKRAAATRSPRSRYGQSIVLSPLRSYQPWNHPWGLIPSKIVISVENHPQKPKNRLADYHPSVVGGVNKRINISSYHICTYRGVKQRTSR